MKPAGKERMSQSYVDTPDRPVFVVVLLLSSGEMRRYLGRSRPI